MPFYAAKIASAATSRINLEAARGGAKPTRRERLLELAQRRGGIEAGLAFSDGTGIRAHHS